MKIAKNIFKAYDIRGLAATELSPELAYRLGRAFVVFLRNHDLLKPGQAVVAGRDMRATSPAFQRALMRGMSGEGAAIVDIGLVSTPLFNFACANYPDYAGGVMVTASHNPARYNGFKMTLGDGLPVGEASGMGEIKELVCHSEYNEESLSSPSARPARHASQGDAGGEGVGGVGADNSATPSALPLGKREMCPVRSNVSETAPNLIVAT